MHCDLGANLGYFRRIGGDIWINLNRLSTERRQSMSFLVSAGPNPGTILIECALTSQAVSLLLGRLSHPSTPAARLPMRSDAVDAEKTGSDGIDPPAAKTGQGPWHCCKCSCVICPLATPRHPDGATNEPAGGLCRKASRRWPWLMLGGRQRAGASMCVTPLMVLSRGQITPRPLPILG